MHELKHEEFAELYADQIKEEAKKAYVTECLIDTDMDIMFSDDYIENVSERITLYRELDSIETEADLQEFQKNTEDRFGKMSDKTLQLLLVVRLRWLAARFGIERLILKNGYMIAYLVSNNASPYYQSEEFGRLLQYMTSNPRSTKLRDTNDKRSIQFMNISNIEKAWELFQRF